MPAHVYSTTDVQKIADRLGEAKQSGEGWACLCPAHDDSNPSLSLTLKPDGTLLWHCHKGCPQDKVTSALRSKGLLINGAGAPNGADPHSNGDSVKPKTRFKIVKSYNYTDEQGRLLFQVVRLDPKSFRQRRPDEHGDWIWNLKDTRKVLYHLSEVLAAEQVIVCEGEKDVDNLRSLGFAATTNPGGAGNKETAKKWLPEYTETLAGKSVIIVGDNDDAGREHVRTVARVLSGKAASVKVVELAGLPPKGDVSDWLAAGHTADELRALIAAAPEWVAPIDEPVVAGLQDLPGAMSHDALALEMGVGWDGTAKHVALWGRWLFWTGTRWEQDEHLLHLTRVREFLRGKAATAPPIASTLRSAKTIAAVAGLARSNRELAARVDLWDRDPWVLNTPGGLVDLRTGRLSPSDSRAYCTKMTAVAPAEPGTPAPLWQAFLARIFRHAPEMIGFMQRVLGYGLTGLTTEHVLVFAWGQGGNGKGVLLNTASRLLGDYAAVAPADMLLLSQSDRHPTDMAGLRGARLVTAQELAPGRTWDEPKLKSLTGGDPVTARFMRQDFFTFEPQFLLIAAGNNKPSLKSVDEAIRRRIRLVPFLQNIPPAERDPRLSEKLKAEWPAILRWMIAGCLEWQRQGLDTPESVKQASDEYLAAEDVLGQWIDERCVVSVKTQPTKLTVLYSDWREWSEKAGTHSGSAKAFSQRLSERGYPGRKSHGTMTVAGLGLRAQGELSDRDAAEPEANPSSSGEDGEDSHILIVPKASPSQTEEEALCTPYMAKTSPSSPAPGQDGVPYRLISTLDEARSVVADLAAHGVPVGLDVETTGLDPLTDQARLLQLAPPEGPVLIVDLAKVGGFSPIREPLGQLATSAHNAVFDMGFLQAAGVRLTPDCTMIAAHVLTGKREKLSVLAERHLGRVLDKAEQVSDWRGELSESQLRYAALDAAAVRDLHPVLLAELEREGSVRAYELARDAQPAVVAMELRGMPFDAAAQRELIERLEVERDRLRAQLGEALPGCNPKSGEQLAKWLTEALGGVSSQGFARWTKTDTGKLETTAEALRKGAADLPPDKRRTILELLLRFKIVEKQCTTYGRGLAKHINPVTGRIHGDFSLAGTVTGRMSCSKPNMQNMPRGDDFRRLFKAPEGRLFAVADYSQMELRVAAILAGEAKLLEAYARGQDTHALTAATLLDKSPGAVTKEERQLAKAVNFGLLFGAGAKRLRAYAAESYGVEMTEAHAEKHRAAWFQAYPAFARWHRKSGHAAEKELAVRTPSGRVRRWPTADGGAKEGFKRTEAFNTPVQGGAAEAMLAALGHLNRGLAASGLDAAPVMVVHDEVIVEASQADASGAARVLEESMVAGFLDVFPQASTTGLVEARVGRSWADK